MPTFRPKRSASDPRWNDARFIRFAMNSYMPLLGAGIRVKRIAADYRHVQVKLHMRWYNRNYVGTHFGGSLYAMTDPFYMLMIMNNLGRDYIVWDKSSHIEFIAPGRGTMTADFHFSQQQVDEILANTADGQKYLPSYSVDVVDEEGQLVARVSKELYIRRKNTQAL